VNVVNVSVTGWLTNANVITPVSDSQEVSSVLWFALQVVKPKFATVT